MKVIQTHEFKDGKFILTRTVSEFTDYELEVLGKLYKNQGLSAYGDEFVPELFDFKLIDQIYLINEEDAMNMSRMLASCLGLGVGISSGANFLAAVLLEDSIGTNVVTVFPDDNKKYLSTDLMNKIDQSEELLSNQIELIDYEVIE